MRWLPVLGVLLLLSGCGLWGPEGGPSGVGRAAAPAPTTAAAAAAALTGADGVQRITVRMTDDLHFVPAVVTAHPGAIEFTVINTGVTPHDLTVEVGSARPGTGNVNGGQKTTFRLTVTAPGEYPFPCVYHVANGMRGVLKVGAE